MPNYVSKLSVDNVLALIRDTAAQTLCANLRNDLTAETSARESADAELGGRIDTETSARKNADTALGGRIDTETSARENADTALGGRIDLLSVIVTPEMHGAVGDGVTDDSAAINAAFTDAKENRKTLVLDKLYRINSDITFDGSSGNNYNTINIICPGKIIPYAKIAIKKFSKSTIEIDIEQGSDTLTGAVCTLGNLENCNVSLRASSIKTTAFQIGGGNTGIHFSTFKVLSNDNYQTLIHGDTTGTQSAFGGYEYIYEFNPTIPILIQNSYDITIKHFEGYFEDNEHKKNAFEIKKGGSIFISSFAQGGQAKYFLYCEDTVVQIGYCFLNSEKYTQPYVNEGLGIAGSSSILIDILKANYTNNAFTLINTKENETLICIQSLFLVPFTTVKTFNRGNGDASLFIGNTVYDEYVNGNNGFSVENISCSCIGRTLTVKGSSKTTSEISAYTSIMSVNRSAKYTTNGCMYDSAGNVYPIYTNGGSNTITTRKTIPANTDIFFSYTYEKTMSLM